MPVVASIGYAGMTSPAVLLIATFFAGFLVLGIQSGINVVGAMIYPTSLRANGSGWQLGIGRIGSIVGPLVGAVLVGMPVQKLYYVVGAAVPSEPSSASSCTSATRRVSRRTRSCATHSS